jgi:methylmalonyl-CoA/ethylmalonyl-CoA epimerase
MRKSAAMNSFPVDHYGFVTHNIPDACAVWCRLLGFAPDGPELLDPEQKVHIQFLTHSGRLDFRIELLAPSEPASPVMKPARAGGGLHHVCVCVATLDDFSDQIGTTPLVPVRTPTPAPAFGGRKVAFAYLTGFGLLEFVERKDAPSLAAFNDPSLGGLRSSFQKISSIRASPG